METNNYNKYKNYKNQLLKYISYVKKNHQCYQKKLIFHFNYLQRVYSRVTMHCSHLTSQHQINWHRHFSGPVNVSVMNSRPQHNISQPSTPFALIEELQ